MLTANRSESETSTMWGEAQDGRRPALRGAPLPDEVRGPMERSFGQSFSDVRVHEGPEAQSVGARAYAQGTDLYFAPGEFQPGTEEGRRLIGHELTHIVQQRHGRASGPQAKDGVDGDADLEAEADRLGVRAARGETVAVPGQGNHPVANAPIQRKVGFEYEIGAVGSAQVLPRGAKEQKRFVSENERARKGKNIKSTFTDDMRVQPRDYLDTGELVDVTTGEQGEGDARFLALTKKDKILIGDGFALEADEGNAVQGGHGAFSNIEFVTDAFEETVDGAARLYRAGAKIVDICQKIEAAGQERSSGGRDYIHAVELGPGGVTGKVLFPARDVSGELQVNIGLRLDRVSTLMRGMAKGGNETQQEEERLRPGREVMGSGINGADTNTDFGAAPDAARAAIDKYKSDGARAGEQDFPGTFGGSGLEGLVALVVSYLKGAAGNRIGYAKSIAPLMARTDFGTLFGQLPDEDKKYIRAHPAAFEAIVADASGLNMGQDMFPNGIYKDPRTAGAGDPNALAGLTRATWVGGIAAGFDFLTAKNFNKGIGKSPADPKYDERKDDLESMGALGSKTEKAGGKDAGIFEMRSLGGLSGKLNYKQLADRLADLYVYVTQLNESGPTDQVRFEKSV